MTVIVRAGLVLLLLAVSMPVVGPAAAAPAAPSLFPLVVNAEWTRKNQDGSEPATEQTSRVTGPKTVGTVRCIVIERKFKDRSGRERVERNCYLPSAAEILVIETTNRRGDLQALKPPRPLLKLPPRVGQTWSWQPEESAFDLKLTSKWVGEESIKVAAGTFKAWKLESVTTGEDLEIRAITWYAPGVGVVRNERKGRSQDRQISGWTELVRYKIP